MTEEALRSVGAHVDMCSSQLGRPLMVVSDGLRGSMAHPRIGLKDLQEGHSLIR